MANRMLLLCMLLVAAAGAAPGADAYFVRFNAVGRQVGGGYMRWVDDILLYNTTAAPVTIHFLGVSDGEVRPDPPDLVLPPGRTLSANATPGISGGWTPLGDPPLWVLHLDVPEGVVMESRDEFYVSFGIPELFPVSRGKVSMPIIRALTPANQRQVHLGTDLGEVDSHINVGIYNAAATPATATIEVRRTCDNAVVTTRTVTLPANSVTQVGGMAVGASDCADSFTPAWMRSVFVSVDQPSFTFVSNVNANIQRPADEADSVPIVGLAAAINQRF